MRCARKCAQSLASVGGISRCSCFARAKILGVVRLCIWTPSVLRTSPPNEVRIWGRNSFNLGCDKSIHSKFSFTFPYSRSSNGGRTGRGSRLLNSVPHILQNFLLIAFNQFIKQPQYAL